MREPERIERIARLIYKIWHSKSCQDLRLMQLLLNPLKDIDSVQLYNLEDDVLEQKLMELYEINS